jgi:hypothetical protein
MWRNRIMRAKLSVIKDRFERAGVHWVIFAGAAASCYGGTRKITDIDILVRSEDLDNAKAALENIDARGFDVGGGGEIKTDLETCEFFLDEEMIGRINWKQLFGVRVPIISVEDNIVLKAILQRGEELGKHDVEDIKSMMTHEKLDLEYIRKRIMRCKAEKRVKPLLQSLIPGLYNIKRKV